jgi:hypothetical protein
MGEKYRAIMPHEILSQEQLATLSSAAIRLYGTVWNRLKSSNSISMWMYDEDLANRSRMPLSLLKSAQSELSQSGLLVLIPGAVQVKYCLPEYGFEVGE